MSRFAFTALSACARSQRTWFLMIFRQSFGRLLTPFSFAALPCPHPKPASDYLRAAPSVMSSSSLNTDCANARSAAARFSFKCASEDVPGISKMFGARCSNHTSAACIGVARSRFATALDLRRFRGRLLI